MQTASGEGEGDKTPNAGDSMVLGVEQVGVSNRVWELGELVRFGNWVFHFFFFIYKIWFSWSVVSFSWFWTEISTPNRFSPYPLLKPNPNFSGTKPNFFFSSVYVSLLVLPEICLSLYLVLVFLLLTFLLPCEVCFLLALFILFLGMNMVCLHVDLFV